MVRPPSPPDPVIISWSGLKRWENCPQHQLRTIQHRVEKSNKGRIFLPGTVCDLTMRQWLESDTPQIGEMEQMVEQVFAKVVGEGESKIPWKGDPREDMARVQNQCRTHVKVLEPWLVKNVLPFDYQPEVKFNAFMDIPYICEGTKAPVKMIGGIDIVVRDDEGKFHLYDLKITSTPSYINSTLAQLIFYDLAWGIINEDFEASVEWGFVTPALEEKLVPITVDLEDRRMMMSRIVKYAQGFWKDEWAPKSDDDGCGWCEARDYCDKFKKIAVVDENGKQRMSFAAAAEHKRQFKNRT